MERDLSAGAIVPAYFAKFGTAGDFDRWLLDGVSNVELMAEALARGTPVTQERLHAKYREVEGDDPPAFPEDSVR
jgi:hypothetical protein